MSVKASAFSVAVPMPQFVSSFFVYIPKINISPFIVEAATYPIDSTEEVAVSFGGCKIVIPSRNVSEGIWNCSLTENAAMGAAILVDYLRDVILYEDAGSTEKVKETFRPIDILIAPSMSTSVIPITGSIRKLRGAWLSKINPISFSASSPDQVLKWELTFKYSYIQ